MTTTEADIQRMSRLFQALADETRLRILTMLCRGECCVCELQESLDSYQSRLSFHLKKLKEAGIVDDRRSGRWVYYVLRPEVLEEMRAFLATVDAECAAWSETEDGCCR